LQLFEPQVSIPLLLLIALAAALYSSVGHGGGSGYLAAMALFGLDPSVMKPAALTMNIFVTVLVFTRLYRAGYFNGRLFLPFVIGSIPMAFLGGAYTVNSSIYKYIVGAALLLAAWWLLVSKSDNNILRSPNKWVAILVGGVLGFVSGLSGVGGGIFLSPLLLFFNWTNMRGSAAIAAGFILLNSIAGLVGYATTTIEWPAGIPAMVIAALLGGVIGSELGARRLSSKHLFKLLSLVLIIAGLKMIATA